MHLAYKYVAVALMLAEVNFTVSKMNLQIAFPISESQIRFALVAPAEWKWATSSGRIDADGYAFSFSQEGKLRFVWKIAPFGNLHMAERNEMLSKDRSMIIESDAYKLATNWLAQIPVDVRKLETRYPAEVRQEYRWRPSDTRKRDLLPLFEVKWGNWDEPKVFVEIDGRTKSLLCLRLEDPSVSEEPPGMIKDLDQLLQVSDQEFLGYSQGQREKMLARFAAGMRLPCVKSNTSSELERKSH
jgi:hypothetical protein